jgi:hypothetical protein
MIPVADDFMNARATHLLIPGSQKGGAQRLFALE